MDNLGISTVSMQDGHLGILECATTAFKAGADLGEVHGVHVHPPSATCKVASRIAVNIHR